MNIRGGMTQATLTKLGGYLNRPLSDRSADALALTALPGVGPAVADILSTTGFEFYDDAGTQIGIRQFVTTSMQIFGVYLIFQGNDDKFKDFLLGAGMRPQDVPKLITAMAERLAQGTAGADVAPP